MVDDLPGTRRSTRSRHVGVVRAVMTETPAPTTPQPGSRRALRDSGALTLSRAERRAHKNRRRADSGSPLVVTTRVAKGAVAVGLAFGVGGFAVASERGNRQDVDAAPTHPVLTPAAVQERQTAVEIAATTSAQADDARAAAQATTVSAEQMAPLTEAIARLDTILAATQSAQPAVTQLAPVSLDRTAPVVITPTADTLDPTAGLPTPSADAAIAGADQVSTTSDTSAASADPTASADDAPTGAASPAEDASAAATAGSSSTSDAPAQSSRSAAEAQPSASPSTTATVTDPAAAQLRTAAERVSTLTEQMRVVTEQAAQVAAAEAARAAAEQEAQQAAALAAAAAEAQRKAAQAASLDAYANGKIPSSALCGLSFATGHELRCDAAEALESLNAAYRAEFGVDLSITDSYRSYSAQVACQAAKGSLCATPGTSNHGNGTAVDFGGSLSGFGSTGHDWLLAHAQDFGWTLPSWARANGSKPEPWHWEFSA